jgi:ABC-2 type transport system ATP-binding protein
MGFVEPTSGRITVFGCSPQKQPAIVLPRVGFLAQDRPLYQRFRVWELLEFGRRLNPRWDNHRATESLERLTIPLDRPFAKLSGGQQVQVALVLTLAKRPELLLLDEPLSNLDPLARREFLDMLVGVVAEDRVTTVLSSHIIADLERTCDYLVILARGAVQLTGEIEILLNSHRTLIGGPSERTLLERDPSVIHSRHTTKQTTVLAKLNGPWPAGQWDEYRVGLEELVIGYLSRLSGPGAAAPGTVASRRRE